METPLSSPLPLRNRIDRRKAATLKLLFWAGPRRRLQRAAGTRGPVAPEAAR